VNKNQAEQMASESNVKHYLVSAKNGTNLKNLFEDLAGERTEVQRRSDKGKGHGQNPQKRKGEI
jgi:hypothetical protein